MNYIVKGEISIETDSGIKIGSKAMELCRLVKKNGSLNMSARELGMSYSYAWNTLYKINCRLEHPLVETRRGGKGGGEAFLTPEGEALLERFMALKQEIQEVIKANCLNDETDRV